MKRLAHINLITDTELQELLAKARGDVIKQTTAAYLRGLDEGICRGKYRQPIIEQAEKIVREQGF